MKFKEWLYSEISYTKEDIPKNFFLGIRWNPQELQAHQLKGIQGLTTNVETAKMYGRGFVLVLNGPQTEAINRLSKILYDKPEYIASKDLAIAARLLGPITSGAAKTNFISKICHNIFADGSEYSNAYEISFGIGKLDGSGPFPVVKKLSNFVGELWRRLQPYLAQHSLRTGFNPFTWEKLKKMVVDELARIGRVYSEEGEWQVKDGILNIPKGSTIFVKEIHVYERLEQIKEDIATYNLEASYKINFMDFNNLYPKFGLGDYKIKEPVTT